MPTDGLVGWWPFNGDTQDSNGSEMTFVLNGSTVLGEDRFGSSTSALTFMGDGSASTPNDGSVPQYGELSVSYWVKRLGGSAAIVALGASNGGSWKSSWGDTGCSIRYADGCGNSSQDNVAHPNFNGVWKHVVMTSDGLSDVFEVFVDGQFVGSGYSSNGGACSVASLHLGVEIWSAPEYFIGTIDDVGVWNRILTQSEVTELYEGDPISTDCLDPQACNFEAVDEECIFPEPNLDCAGNCLNDANNKGVCDELECFEEVAIDVVLGESVTLTAFDLFQSSTLIWSNQMTFSGPSSLTTPVLSEGVSYRLEINGFYDITTSAYGLKDAAWYFCYFGCGCDCNSNNPAPVNLMNGEIIPVELRPTPDVYNPNHFYEYFFQGDGNVMNFSFTDDLYADNSGLLSFSLYELSSSDFTWSNGALGPSVTITPTESMSYEVAIVGDLGQFCTGVYFVNVLNPGCTDEGACNYDIDAEVDNQTCLYPEPNLDCAGNCLNDTDGDGVCDEFEISGCTDATACNYLADATDDDASCTYPSEPFLDCDGNCLNDTNNNGICDELDVPGCTFEGACNYNPEATVNDDSCFFATAVFDCEGNCLQDENNNGICDQLEALAPQLCGESTVWNEDLGACVCEGFNPCPADMNENGVIDVADLLMFLTLIGQPCY